MKSQMISCILKIFQILTQCVVKYANKQLCESDLEDELITDLEEKLSKYLSDMPIDELVKSSEDGLFNDIDVMRVVVVKLELHGIYQRPEMSSIRQTYRYLKDEESKKRKRARAEAATSLKLAPSLSPKVLEHIQRGEYRNPCNFPSCEGFPTYKRNLQGRAVHELLQRLTLAKALKSMTEYGQLMTILTRLRDSLMLPIGTHSVAIDMMANWKLCANCTYREYKLNYGEKFLPAVVPCKDTCEERLTIVTNFNRTDDCPSIFFLHVSFAELINIIGTHEVIRLKFTNWSSDPIHSYKDEIVCEHQKYVESWTQWTF
ncbi:hypothetical protein QAD02_013164 [Eretmocerus hayati]|uniref:Uncharacterized protein n=1 Tax=Eretmocerus hayati TaxID=131215 RepID=A0ACC2P1X3_9HYME|nr:hypothetical protein QAD02_013164 [Eretmocerus hayati]